MKVVLPKFTQKQLDKIPDKEADKILKKIHQLEHDPFPHGYEKLGGGAGYRIRLGEYRMIYCIDKINQLITISRIRPRGSAYKP